MERKRGGRIYSPTERLELVRKIKKRIDAGESLRFQDVVALRRHGFAEISKDTFDLSADSITEALSLPIGTVQAALMRDFDFAPAQTTGVVKRGDR